MDGALAPTSEVELHLAVYRLHDAGAVVHTHAPAATALSCVLDELPCVHYEMLLLGGAVPVAPYATFGTPELARAVVRPSRAARPCCSPTTARSPRAPTWTRRSRTPELLEWAATSTRAQPPPARRAHSPRSNSGTAC